LHVTLFDALDECLGVGFVPAELVTGWPRTCPTARGMPGARPAFG
jgi:hypothetical protein